MKTIIRNLLSLIRRFKMASLLNILCLSVAFAAFMLLMIQVNYDRYYDRGYKDAENIFRVEWITKSWDGISANTPRPLAEVFFQSSPHILSGTLINPWGGSGSVFSIEHNGQKNNYQEDIVLVSNDFIGTLGVEILQGDSSALSTTDKVMLPESLAKKFFGNSDPIGKLLLFGESAVTIGAIYKDFPPNSSMKDKIIRLLSADENKNNWNNWNYSCFVKLDNPANAKEIETNFIKVFQASQNTNESVDKDTKARLTPISQLHTIKDVNFDFVEKTSQSGMIVLFAIGIIIILIAAINFTNFSTALTPMRVKSINIQKVLGSKTDAIRRALVMEAIGISLLSFLLSILWLNLAANSHISDIMKAPISISGNLNLVFATLCISILTGLFAGLYPAFYMTSFAPAIVLKGSFGLSAKGVKMRNVLVSIQFVSSFILIIVACFMFIQNRFMEKSDLGFDSDAIIVTNVNKNILKSDKAFVSEIKSNPAIKEIAFGNMLFCSSDSYMNWGQEFKEKQMSFDCLPVDPNFLDVMSIKITDGRNFREDDKLTQYGAFIFNETARKQYDLQIGDKVRGGEIVGFAPDVNYASMRVAVAPMAFYVWGTKNWGDQRGNAYIKVNAGSNLGEAIDHVQKTIKKFDNEYPFNVRFYDKVIESLYTSEQNTTVLITMFSLIAILISIVGVFGLVVFESEYRRKEIGLRKVMGATTRQILTMFNKTYMRILLICFAISVPIATYFVKSWLENFAYKTPLYWWVYAFALILVALFTLLVVTFQTWKTANENPVESIKTE